MANHHYTWDKLVKNAYRLNPKTRGPKYPYTPRFEYSLFSSGPNSGQKIIVPYKGTRSLFISLRAWGVTQASLHNVTMMFSDVDIVTENPESNDYFQVQYDGVMYWCKKLDKYRNPLTSRCTCFTGDTKVLLADGSTPCIKDLPEMFFVNSFDLKTKQYMTALGGNAGLRELKARVIELTFDDGYKVKCTPDHKFLTVDNLYAEAETLLGKDVKTTLGKSKVINIQEAGRDDVYCLTVPQFGNFALGNGVIVSNCRDFFFTFAFYNHATGCLYGPKPRPYVRKTTTYPPRNKLSVPGACKHIHNAWAILRNTGLTVN